MLLLRYIEIACTLHRVRSHYLTSSWICHNVSTQLSRRSGDLGNLYDPRASMTRPALAAPRMRGSESVRAHCSPFGGHGLQQNKDVTIPPKSAGGGKVFLSRPDPERFGRQPLCESQGNAALHTAART